MAIDECHLVTRGLAMRTADGMTCQRFAVMTLSRDVGGAAQPAVVGPVCR